jgi:WhiB family redox-sensing transcriptional regulator
MLLQNSGDARGDLISAPPPEMGFRMSTSVRKRADWGHHAACRSMDPDLFFPAGKRGAGLQLAAAVAVCHACPVESDCLGWALANGQMSGVWGGTTEAQRRALGIPPQQLSSLDR